MAFATVIIETKQLGADVANQIKPQAANKAKSLARLGRYIEGMGLGARRGVVNLRTSAVKSTATITFTGAPTANDTFVLCGTTFTAKASGATTNEFNIGGTVTETATNVAAAINASNAATVTASVVATSSAGVVTITALDPGAMGNGLRLTESLDNATRVDFAGGSNGTSTTLTAGGAS